MKLCKQTNVTLPGVESELEWLDMLVAQMFVIK